MTCRFAQTVLQYKYISLRGLKVKMFFQIGEIDMPVIQVKRRKRITAADRPPNYNLWHCCCAVDIFADLRLTIRRGTGKIDSVWCTLVRFGLQRFMITGCRAGVCVLHPDLGFCYDFCRASPGSLSCTISNRVHCAAPFDAYFLRRRCAAEIWISHSQLF